MKKFMKLFFVLLIVTGLFTACNRGEESETSAATEEKEQMYFGSRPMLTIESMEEYNKFLETMPDVDGFVTYDMIKEIGTFKHFVCLSDSRFNDYSHYTYGITDDTGSEFILYVKHTNDTSLNVTEAIGVLDAQDMRLADEERHGIYQHQGFIYKYYSGKLNSIIWYAKGREFVLAGVGANLADYPATSENTFISKLLKQETAVAAVESIKSKVEIK